MKRGREEERIAVEVLINLSKQKRVKIKTTSTPPQSPTKNKRRKNNTLRTPPRIRRRKSPLVTHMGTRKKVESRTFRPLVTKQESDVAIHGTNFASYAVRPAWVKIVSESTDFETFESMAPRDPRNTYYYYATVNNKGVVIADKTWTVVQSHKEEEIKMMLTSKTSIPKGMVQIFFEIYTLRCAVKSADLKKVCCRIVQPITVPKNSLKDIPGLTSFFVRNMMKGSFKLTPSEAVQLQQVQSLKEVQWSWTRLLVDRR